MEKTKRMLKFYNDPGHGWLEAKRSDIEALNIQDKISGYSYQTKTKVYLEEDCDASVYLGALKAAGIEYKIDNHYTDNSCFIRGLQSYTPQGIQTPDQKKIETGAVYVQKVANAVAADPNIIQLVKEIEAGVKTTKFNYGKYVAVLGPHAKEKLFLMGLSLGLIQAGADPEGVSWARRLLIGVE